MSAFTCQTPQTVGNCWIFNNNFINYKISCKIAKIILSPCLLAVFHLPTSWTLLPPLLPGFCSPIPHYHGRSWSCGGLNRSLGSMSQREVLKAKENINTTKKPTLFYFQRAWFEKSNLPFKIIICHCQWSVLFTPITQYDILDTFTMSKDKRTLVNATIIFFYYYFIQFYVNIFTWYLNFCFHMYCFTLLQQTF